ncbi:MAG: translocation/assembly module TamB domain-containing protein [Sulfurimonas sp.]|uniref:translocation/assembly module TamB domain-containing protein n=1 Tax=Sulfurimonas sp. TaxID=2022749 RepID=UPI002613DEDE|nr:translocation/assembly module TamB domain-containing protein [Sulfurimonas sp.]MDD5400099.1 translocation/assembly module TamB domain-containing protein [Sulfurimonas sp.]
MIKKIYLFFSNILKSLIFLAAVGFFILFQEDIAVYLAKQQLEEYSIEYKSIEGRLFDGVVVKELKYKDIVKIDELKINYNFLMLLTPTPRLKSLSAEGVYVDADKALKLSSTQTTPLIFALNISNIDLKNGKVRYKEELYSFDLIGSDLSIRDKIDFENIVLDLNTSYGKAFIEGNIKANHLRGKSVLLVDKKIEERYLGFLAYTPKKLDVDLDISTTKMNLKTSIKKITHKEIENLELNSADINLIYNFKDDFLTIFANYKAFYENLEAFVKQESLVRFDAKYESKLKVDFIKDGFDLPFKDFVMKIKTDKNGSKIDFAAQDISIKVDTRDYKKFLFYADTKYANFDGKFEVDKNLSSLHSEVYPKKDMPYFNELKLEKIPKFNLFVSKNRDEIRADLSTNLISLTLQKGNTNDIKGIAKIGSSRFDIVGNLDKKLFQVDSNIESLNALFRELDLKLYDKNILFDAKVKANMVISYKNELEITARLDLPWYTLKLNSQSSYTNKDAFFEFFYKNSEVTLQRYKVEILNYKIHSDKPSKVVIDKNGDIALREFWIYDNLLLSGLVKLSDMSADINIKSDNFHYETKDVNVTLKMDLQATLDSTGREKIEGDITILGGSVMYALQKEFSMGDEDIIIIQDIKKEDNKESKKENRELNIRINSLKPMSYKVKDVDVTFTPDLTLYQEAGAQMKLLGMITIHKGKVILRDKIFEFDESEIYFYDEKYTNPYLNLNLHYHTLDYVDIGIFITNRVDSPVILFSSNPQMSQEDIMSYILFGGSASSVFDSSGKSSKTALSSALLGAGLKELLNKSTNLKIDTLNILTNDNGTLGYEIGTRFNKRIRIVYKNNEISTLILQYGINKSVRIDVEVKETGQGVTIYYMKDFKSPQWGDLKK